jgi:hypothetical protein
MTTRSSTPAARRIARIAAVALAAPALVAPAAVARPVIDPPSTSSSQGALSTQAAGGFDWGSAGAAGGLVLIALGGFSAAHRARIRQAVR